MPTILCPVTIDCPGSDDPTSNYSSEAPDRITFGATGFPIFFPDDPFGIDPIDPSFPPAWLAAGCGVICFSTESQEAADACAARQAYLCFNDGGFTGGGHDGHGGGPIVGPPGVFYNTEQQCAYTCPDGSHFNWVVFPGWVVSGSQALSDRIAQQIACQMANTHFFCFGQLNGAACINQFYNQSITLGGANPGPFLVELVSGVLPPGLDLSQNPTAVIISGTPTGLGTFPFTLKATAPNNTFITKQFMISVVGIVTTSPLPDAQTNLAYSIPIIASGGVAPYTFSKVLGTLPSGLSISAAGVLSGTPIFGAGGDYAPVFQATDANGVSCTKAFTLHVKDPPGPDWSKLVWDQYTLVPHLPLNTVNGFALGPVATGSLNKAATDDNFPMIAPVHASLLYTGPACNCRMTVTTTQVGNTSSMNCGVKQNGGALGGYAQIPVTSGTHIFNFALAPGVNSLIEIGDTFPGTDWALVSQAGLAGSLQFTFVVQNV